MGGPEILIVIFCHVLGRLLMRAISLTAQSSSEIIVQINESCLLDIVMLALSAIDIMCVIETIGPLL